MIELLGAELRSLSGSGLAPRFEPIAPVRELLPVSGNEIGSQGGEFVLLAGVVAEIVELRTLLDVVDNELPVSVRHRLKVAFG